MKLTNYTKIPSDRLREMIRFCLPTGVTGFDISFKNDGDGSLHGYCYYLGTSYHAREVMKNGKISRKCPPLITIHVPQGWSMLRGRRPGYKDPRKDDQKYGRPVRYSTGNGYINEECFTDEERLVHIIAHELRHLWQHRVKKGRRVWGARNGMSERDADAYGIHKTREWRRR